MYSFKNTYDDKNDQASLYTLKSNVKVKKNDNVGTSQINSDWSQCLQIIRDNTTESVFKTWFTTIKPLKYEKNALTLTVPSHFFLQWIEEHYCDILLKTVYRVFGEGSTIEYKIVIDKSNAQEERTMTLPGKTEAPRQVGLTFEDDNEETPYFNTNLDEAFSFANFVMGDSNQFAASASKAVADKPQKNSYSPLFLYGKTGVGKTHLLNAIGNHCVNKNKGFKVVYTSSNKFKNDFVEAVMKNAIPPFVNKYRKVDVLLVDDIQGLDGQVGTQDNFFSIFNELVQQGKLIVLSSDKPVSELVGIEERLISRFSQGLCVDIQAPNYETRLAIIIKKSRDEGRELPMDIAQYIAQNVTQNVRTIEGAILKLLAAIAFNKNSSMTLEFAKKILGQETQAEAKPKKLDVNLIQDLVSVHMGITIDDMVSKSRKHEIVLARQMAIALTRALTRLPLKKIGAAFGGRDHATVLHSIKTIEDYKFTDKLVKRDHDTLLVQCNEYL